MNNKKIENDGITELNFPDNFDKSIGLWNKFISDVKDCYCSLKTKIAMDCHVFIVYKPIDFFTKQIEPIFYDFFEKYKYFGEEDKNISFFRGKMDMIRKKYCGNNFFFENPVKICIFFHYPSKNLIIDKFFLKKTVESNTLVLNIEPMMPKYKLNQMVLSDEVTESLTHSLTMILNTHRIYYDWGFIDVDPIPKTILNFYGPPGTGKTMAAHAVASQLEKKILPLNYADIESKYVGDAPKNLIAAFNKAQTEDCILFFDEADSFLGKRITNVSSSSDQAINSLRSQMLILLESYKNIVIFATNLHENYDPAFESRILQHIKFNLPDKELRKITIEKMIPKKAPINFDILNNDLLYNLSDLTEGFSYREIKNNILDTLTKCVEYSSEITSSLLIETFSQAQRKFDERKSKTKTNKDKIEKVITKNLSSGDYIVQNQELNNSV